MPVPTAFAKIMAKNMERKPNKRRNFRTAREAGYGRVQVAEVALKTVQKFRFGIFPPAPRFGNPYGHVYAVLKQESLMCGTGKSFDRKNEM